MASQEIYGFLGKGGGEHSAWNFGGSFSYFLPPPPRPRQRVVFCQLKEALEKAAPKRIAPDYFLLQGKIPAGSGKSGNSDGMKV